MKQNNQKNIRNNTEENNTEENNMSKFYEHSSDLHVNNSVYYELIDHFLCGRMPQLTNNPGCLN